MAEKSVDPFPNLPRKVLFVAVDESPRKSPDVETKKAVAEAAITAPKRARGRPKTIGGEPWKVAGVSRSQWFRRQKEKKK